MDMKRGIGIRSLSIFKTRLCWASGAGDLVRWINIGKFGEEEEQMMGL